jgi:hypothetical protein
MPDDSMCAGTVATEDSSKDEAITDSKWATTMHSRTLKTPVAILVMAAVVAVIGTIYLLTELGAHRRSDDANAVPVTTSPTAQPQTRAIPINSVRRGDDPRTLSVEYAVGVGDCSQTLDRADVKETSTTVTLSLVPKPSTKPMPANCFDQVLLLRTTVRLVEPLGERQVIDARTGATLRVE